MQCCSGQSNGSKCLAVIFSTASLSSYLFFYSQASIPHNAGFILSLNRGLMHSIGTQTETISGSSTYRLPVLVIVPSSRQDAYTELFGGFAVH